MIKPSVLEELSKLFTPGTTIHSLIMDAMIAPDSEIIHQRIKKQINERKIEAHSLVQKYMIEYHRFMHDGHEVCKSWCHPITKKAHCDLVCKDRKSEYFGQTYPAVIWRSGRKAWVQNERHHRTDIDPKTGKVLPALIDDNGIRSWYYNGVQHTEEELTRKLVPPRKITSIHITSEKIIVKS
jgi:hypothetical protein